MNSFKVRNLFDTSHTLAGKWLDGVDLAHEILPKIKEIVLSLGSTLESSFEQRSEGVWVAKDATVSESAVLCAPCIIGHGTEVRPGAYIRGAVLIGDGCVIGNSTEIKNAIIFDGAELPHYNYVGDSIIGYRAHMGAGVIASNLRLDKKSVILRTDSAKFDTGLRKLGVLLGDFAEVGCNSVLSPGTVIGRKSIIYPLTSVRGYVPSGVKFANDGIIGEVE